MASRIACYTDTLSQFTRPVLFNNAGLHLRLSFYSIRAPPAPIHCSRRLSDFSKEGESLDGDPRNWSSNRSSIASGGYSFGDNEDEEEEEEEEDRSLDLLIRFVQNMFRKISRKARKAVRSVLPVPISSQLFPGRRTNTSALFTLEEGGEGSGERGLICTPSNVGFSVNGVIILTFMWVLKAFLEVVCTLGSLVFVSILLIRGTWMAISYLQERRNHGTDELDDEHRTWRGSQPAT